MSNYKLSATLEGHEQDVKAIVSPYNDTIVSASRDSSVKVWTQNNGVWTASDNFSSTGFVNSLAFDKKNNLVVSGGQDKLVNITDLFSSGVDAKYVLIGHSANVCSLDASRDEIISGSWDSTAKVWENHQEKYSLVGHNASVWDVKILGDGRYLTSSADRTVKLWQGSKEIKTYIGHSDVVRGLALLPDGTGFASTSNDGTVRIVNFDGTLIQTLVGHESFVYAIKFLSNGDIVTSGEDRTVRIWRDGSILQVIRLPSISIWTISILPNDDIVTGGSDSVVRVFTKDSARFASEAEIKELQDSLEGSSINSQTIDDSKTLGPEALETTGSKEGQVIMVKTLQGIIEAHQWSEGKWSKIGEVVGSSSSEKKQILDGKKWDYVFDVDVREGAPPLKLPYNSNENPYAAATRFLEANDLPDSYTEEVVRFITTNTQGVNINQASEVQNPYADQRKKIIPHTDYLGFTIDNAGSLMKGIEKLNTSEKDFDEKDLKVIKNAITFNDSTVLLTTALKIIKKWENVLPGYDLLRLITPKLPNCPENLEEIVANGLQNASPQVIFMTFRFLSNIFLNKVWGESIVTDSKIVNIVLNGIVSLDQDIEAKHLVNIVNAIATTMINYSVYCNNFKASALTSRLASGLNKFGLELSKYSSEAAYRLSVAYGNFIYVKKELKGSQFESFKKEVLSVYKEERFNDLFKDIDEIY